MLVLITCLSAGAETPRIIRLSMMENAPLATSMPVKTLTEAYGRMGYTLKITALPFPRSLAAADHGEYDGEVGRLVQIEQSTTHLRRVPVAVGRVEYVPYVRRETTTDLSSWIAIRKSGLRVGARHGARLVEVSLEGAPLTLVNSYESLEKMLLMHRIDVMIAQSGQLEGNAQIVPLAPIASEPLYHYLHERNQALIAPLTKELKRMGAYGVGGRLR